MTGHEIHWLSWTGSGLLSVCGLPQAIKAKRSASSTKGLSWAFLWCWLLGEVVMCRGVWSVVSWPVVANYVMNIALIGFIMRVKARQT